MPETSMDSESRKTALKQLKAARKAQIAAATGRMKEQRRAVKAIKQQLNEAELTVPELAAATGLPPSEVLFYVASLKKYGEVLESAKAGSYYRYRLGQPLAEETAPDSAE
jgi:predicted Rossmann fold nucleotide-binding protein DprA/Smf involved in DNA uptake